MKTLTLLVTCMALTGCGFHFRNKDTLPVGMNSIAIESPNSNFAAQLEDTFNSIHIQPNHTSPYQLVVTHYQLDQSSPEIITADAPATVTYSLTVTVELHLHHKMIASHNFSSSQVVIQNMNSLQARKAAPTLILQFHNDIIQQIYLWLSSNQIKQDVNQTHAN